MTRAVVAVAVGLVTLALAGCGGTPTQPTAGVGVWQLSDSEGVDETTERLDIEVSRLECSGGVTGEVLEPVVTFEPDRILVRTDVAPLPEGAYDCQGNDWVSVTVELGEAVGDREIVDAACLDEPAVSTTFCEDGGVRWSPTGS